MAPFRIKICGVTNTDDALFAIEHGADAIGLNFYEQSSRYVCPPGAKSSNPEKHDAVQIVKSIRQWTDSEKAKSVKVIGVFVNLKVDQIFSITNQLGLDGIQLHGDEPASHAKKIRDLVEPIRPILIVRAVRTNPKGDHQSDLDREIRRIEDEIKTWANSGIDAVLLDAAVAGEFGGTGKSVDWYSVPKINSKVPLILAGGLTASNVAEAIRCAQVQAVDVASGVESSPGKKDDELVRQFIASARG